jgi:hypothetical protein
MNNIRRFDRWLEIIILDDLTQDELSHPISAVSVETPQRDQRSHFSIIFQQDMPIEAWWYTLMSFSGRDSYATLVGLTGVDPPKVYGGGASPISASSPGLDGLGCLSSSFLQFKDSLGSPYFCHLYILFYKICPRIKHMRFDIASVLGELDFKVFLLYSH